MAYENRPSRYRVFLIGAFLLLVGGTVARHYELFGEAYTYRLFANKVRDTLMKRLVHEDPLPGADDGHLPDPSAVVYILGGGQDSLNYKFRSVGGFYREGLVKKILVLRTPGLTEYSPALGRNLTNDEWVVMELGEEGVAGSDVELVSLPISLFGTFGEARGISSLARSRGIKHLVLLSSRHHTERVRLTFTHFNADNAIELYTCGSGETVGIHELLTESVKLSIYRYLLLPADRLFHSLREFGDTRPRQRGISMRSQRLRR